MKKPEKSKEEKIEENMKLLDEKYAFVFKALAEYKEPKKDSKEKENK